MTAELLPSKPHPLLLFWPHGYASIIASLSSSILLVFWWCTSCSIHLLPPGPFSLTITKLSPQLIYYVPPNFFLLLFYITTSASYLPVDLLIVIAMYTIDHWYLISGVATLAAPAYLSPDFDNLFGSLDNTHDNKLLSILSCFLYALRNSTLSHSCMSAVLVLAFILLFSVHLYSHQEQYQSCCSQSHFGYNGVGANWGRCLFLGAISSTHHWR